MNISLHLKKQCIQTAAKNRYEMLMRSYFKNHKSRLTDKSRASDKKIEADKSRIGKISTIEEKEKIETEIEYLLFFLENADFAYLRHAYPQLSGVEDISVVLQIKRNSNSCKDIIDNSIDKKEDFDADINDFTILVDNHVLPVKNR